MDAPSGWGCTTLDCVYVCGRAPLINQARAECRRHLPRVGCQRNVLGKERRVFLAVWRPLAPALPIAFDAHGDQWTASS
jgi:hypothetical protein